MTVKELIEKLKEFPEECDIFVEGNNRTLRWILGIEENRRTALLVIEIKIL